MLNSSYASLLLMVVTLKELKQISLVLTKRLISQLIAHGLEVTIKTSKISQEIIITVNGLEI